MKSYSIIPILLIATFLISGCVPYDEGVLADYEVLDTYCLDISNDVTMKSLGNRQDQVFAGLIYLYLNCQNSETYYVSILEPTKECLYGFDGEIARLWYEGIGEDDLLISEESKRIIEEDIGFSLWKSFGRIAYEFEMENGISKMTDSQMILSRGYQGYLENGITYSTLINYTVYVIDHPGRCE
jgi:hypothetical protein